MIARLKGIILESTFSEILIDVNGVGYQVFIPISTYDALPQVGKTAEIFTEMAVKEDAITLYGFASKIEKELFNVLMSVSGVGPKLALSILSCMPIPSFCAAISTGDVNSIKSINGIGKKTAERLIVELKDKVDRISPESKFAVEGSGSASKEGADAIRALEQLGVKHESARKAVLKLIEELPESQRSIENLIRKALQSINP
ncbi:MAG: Holliday junction DNA helicase RuvA [Lentisphaerae bacterium GWF2_45_14]|nr:MAG: Holliday junction DNA helicase RuvA [Lentisphaerae bacterium GWF2_45_14]